MPFRAAEGLPDGALCAAWGGLGPCLPPPRLGTTPRGLEVTGRAPPVAAIHKSLF